MATKVIKFNDGINTYVPVTVASAVQYSYNGGVMSVQDALGTVVSAVIPAAGHFGAKDIDFSYNNGTVNLTGIHVNGKKIIKGDGLTYIKSSGDNIIIGTSATNNEGTVKSVTITQGEGITVSNSGTSITSTGTRTITHATPANAKSGEKLAGTGKYFSSLETDKFGHVIGYSTADLPSFTDTDTTVFTNGSTTVTADHKQSQKITLEGGTNKFTVNNGVSSFDVAVTPSISNNVTGNSGWTKAGYLTATNAASGNVIKQSTLAIDDVATKEYVNDKLTGLIDFKGNWPSTTPTTIEQYDAWRIQTAADNWNGTGHKVEVGDIVLALQNNPGTTKANWTVIQNNIDVSGLVKSISGSGDAEISITPTPPSGPDSNGNVELKVYHTSHNVGNVSASDKNVTGTTSKQKVITGITVNSFGHVTGYTAANIYSTDTKSNISGEYRAATKSAYIKLSNDTGEVGFYDNGGKTTEGTHVAYIQFTYTNTSTDKRGIGLKVSYTDTNTAVAKIGDKSSNDVPLYVGPNATNTAAGNGGNTMTFVQGSNISLVSDKTNNKLTINHGATSASSVTASATQTIDIAKDGFGHVTAISKVDIATMGAATASAAGTKGFVPAPPAGSQNKVLTGSATFKTISATQGNHVAGLLYKTMDTAEEFTLFDDGAFTGAAVSLATIASPTITVSLK